MKKTINISFFAFLAIIIVSCSTRKNKALNRGFHAMNTKYNILYNGEVAYDQALEALNSYYVDDYWKRLPIEPLKVEEIALPGSPGSDDNSNQLFEKAEEKAVKAVQKHGMNIGGEERNSQIDDAYFMLGKSRYYSQRFVPALDAFNYIIKNYPEADLINETKIWRAKCLIRLNTEDGAYDILHSILKKKSLYEEYIIEDSHTAMAMVFTALDSTSMVLHHLQEAVKTKNNREQRARNLFIIGQIYLEQGKKDEAKAVFERIIEMKKIPYKYKIHSEIERVKSYNDSTDYLALNRRLTKLINTRENRPYLDELYFQAGVLYEQVDQGDLAIQSYHNSVHTEKAKKFQKSKSYESLGDIYFDRAQFVFAGAYYDSVLQISQGENTKRIRKLKRKRENLKEVIANEFVAHHTDSILILVSMSEEERKVYFQSYVDELLAIKKAEEQKKAYENSGFGGFSSEGSQNSSNGKWYFYNQQLSGIGVQKFKQKWGTRPLEDNWRISEKELNNNDQNNPFPEIPEEVLIAESKKYDVNTYIEKIPTEEKEIDSLEAVRNKAYYNLGLIYKEQFKENVLAINKFETLLNFEPEDKYVLSSKYHLYQLYSEENSKRANKYKEDILTNHAGTKFAALILNPNTLLDFDEDAQSPEKFYEETYADYLRKDYDAALEKTEKGISMFEGMPILSKFELLHAYVIGKCYGVEEFKKALEYVSLNYANTDQGKKAAEVLKNISRLQ